jgi:hypothetical protein
MKGGANNITGENAGGRRQLPMRTRSAARIAQFLRSATQTRKEAHMMEQKPTCEICSSAIGEGNGYIFCPSKIGTGVLSFTSGMKVLLCEKCANSICSAEGFAKTMPTMQDVAPAAGSNQYELRRQLAQDSLMAAIAHKCRSHGLSPEQAKTKANEFGRLWSENPKTAEAKAFAFWNPGEKKPGAGCFIATACYGSPVEWEVCVLRVWRDNCLLTTRLGEFLVTAYLIQTITTYRVCHKEATVCGDDCAQGPIGSVCGNHYNEN